MGEPCRLPSPAPAQGKDSKDVKDETAEERVRRRAYERGCQRLKKRIEGLSPAWGTVWGVEDLCVCVLRGPW